MKLEISNLDEAIVLGMGLDSCKENLFMSTTMAKEARKMINSGETLNMTKEELEHLENDIVKTKSVIDALDKKIQKAIDHFSDQDKTIPPPNWDGK